MLARIAALLRQAEGNDNPHEADAFMSTAQRLATAASIDLAVARSHGQPFTRAGPDTAHYHHRGGGHPRTVDLCAALSCSSRRTTTCAATWHRIRRSYLRVRRDIPTPANALYASLVVQMVRASDAYLAFERHWPTPTITARLNSIAARLLVALYF